MPKKGCNHTQAYIVARALRRRRELGAYEAVYDGVPCPVDGVIHHLTRLAAIVFTLRRDYAWAIKVERETGKLATYVLLGEGMLPDATRGGDK